MTPEESARRRHAGRTSRVARAGLVIAVIVVTGSVGVGTWVLGSGADAAPRRVEPSPVLSGVTKSQPPLSIAPPPESEPKRAAKASAAPTTAKKTAKTAKKTAQKPAATDR